VVNPRTSQVEPPEVIVARVQGVPKHLPPERLFLNPDCGFGAFASRSVNTSQTAARKPAAIADAAAILRA
jgi:5-methyltetrahydropteroyltriglutamate--homocysteine methyltransferase